MLSLARRIVDRRVLHLIKMWLECAVEETDTEVGRHARPRPKISGAAFRRAASITPRTQRETSSLSV